jgi:hypothetical protein
MSDELELEVLSRMRKAFDDYKAGRITKADLRAKMFQEAAVLEQDQWRIVEDLRKRAPESERELAGEVADLMEATLRGGSGNA